MKAKVNQGLRKRRKGVKDAVRINHITMYAYNGLIMVSIDTEEKWPEFSLSSDSGPGDFRAWSVHFHGNKDGNPLLTKVTFIPETDEEKALFRDGYCLELSQRYGPSYIIAPAVPAEAEQVILYG